MKKQKGVEKKEKNFFSFLDEVKQFYVIYNTLSVELYLCYIKHSNYEELQRTQNKKHNKIE